MGLPIYKPCKFCGHDKPYRQTWSTDHPTLGSVPHNIACGGEGCFATGPAGATLEEAVFKWNAANGEAGKYVAPLDLIETVAMPLNQGEIIDTRHCLLLRFNRAASPDEQAQVHRMVKMKFAPNINAEIDSVLLNIIGTNLAVLKGVVPMGPADIPPWTYHFDLNRMASQEELYRINNALINEVVRLNLNR